jgi:glycosyltransferase involved in cell wall biosynthesis
MLNTELSPEEDSLGDSRKLIIIPAYMNALGGMTVSLALLMKGFQSLDSSEKIRVLVRADTLMEEYFNSLGLANCIEILKVSPPAFFEPALDWTYKRPYDWPLLLDNSVWKERLPGLIKASWPLRKSHRPTYHFCHDLALSHNRLGYLARKFTFACLSPKAICNSHYTAAHVRSIMPNIHGILYQPVDLGQIDYRLTLHSSPPDNLKSILESGAKVMLTPSRINQPGIINDKNLRALLPVIKSLKQKGYHYHSVIIGEDSSEGKARTKALIQEADKLGIADRFSILPPTFDIEDYYKFSDLVVTLAPREPFGRTVTEAIACGVPVIGSNTGGIHEILQNFAPHWTVDPNDSNAVADKIIQVQTNQANTQNLLVAGRKWVEDNCSIEQYARGMMELVGLTPGQ